MVTQVRLKAPGGPGMLETVEVKLTPPGPGEILIRQEAVGVNFLDIYYRTGLYPLPSLPQVLGVEGAGIVEAAGEGVSTVEPGTRIAYAGAPMGAYASHRLLPETRAIRIPDAVSSVTAAAALVRGITAQMLLRRICPVGPGQTLLVHAAAGGLGQFLTRRAKRDGATVIAVVGSPEKAAIARDCGADHIIEHRREDVVARAREITQGRGVDAVIDGIGGDMLMRSIACLRPFGVVASIGQAGGPIPPLDVTTLRAATLSRPSVMAFMTDTEAYRSAASEVLDLVASGFPVAIGARFALTEAASAQTELEAGRTTGSIVLIPAAA
ncbi:NADPH2:quinone reductase [Rhizobiales bacterium GAS191]|nr:NADPH2:quinone reductase [Rhizobiales bacterium GAS113]SEE87830.1 NADPH2:quinone reductase [Rhizobiales bacterium GAS191]